MSLTTTTSSATTVDYYTNQDNDLFLKYFLIDSSFNNRGWAVDPSHISRLAKQSIGIPFTDYEDFPITPFNDGHPWSTKESATYQDHLEHAKSKATGIVVDFSPVSRNALKSASGLDIQQNNGYYVTVKVTNPKRKEQYLKNPARIPRVSPGIFDYNFTKLPAKNLSNIDIVHLAGVRYGAYGEKARLYASCSGGYECVNHLKGASTDNDNDITTMGNSSLGDSQQNSTVENIMVDNNNVTSNNNSNEQQPPQPAGEGTVIKQETQIPNQNNPSSQQQQLQQPVATTNTNNSNTGSPIERLKTKYYTTEKQSQQVVQQNWKEDPDYQKLLKEHEELKAKVELEDQKKFYAELIPKEVFIINGKFNAEGYSKEIEKAIEKKLDPEFAKDYYSKRLENIRLSNKLGGKPYGASSSFAVDFSNVTNDNNRKSQQTVGQGYKTPDQVPEVKGASDNDAYSSQFQSLNNIRRMFGLVNNNNGGNV